MSMKISSAIMMLIAVVAHFILCEPESLLILLPGCVVTAFVAGIEIDVARSCAFDPSHPNPFRGSIACRIVKFAFVTIFHILAVLSYIEITRGVCDTLWEMSLTYYLAVIIIRIFQLVFAEPDPNIHEKFDKERWLREIHNDPLTSDTTEEDWHEDRSQEDWHGM